MRLNRDMRIIEILHGRPLREDGTDLTEPAPASGVSVAPGLGSVATPALASNAATMAPNKPFD
jgi:hypothetical protein